MIIQLCQLLASEATVVRRYSTSCRQPLISPMPIVHFNNLIRVVNKGADLVAFRYGSLVIILYN